MNKEDLINNLTDKIKNVDSDIFIKEILNKLTVKEIKSFLTDDISPVKIKKEKPALKIKPEEFDEYF